MKGTRRYRYIHFQVTYEKQNVVSTHSEFIQALRRGVYELFSKSPKELGLWVVQFDGVTGVLKCHYQEKENGIQLLQSLKKIGTNPVTVVTHVTSGTIHGLTQKKRNPVR